MSLLKRRVFLGGILLWILLSVCGAAFGENIEDALDDETELFVWAERVTPLALGAEPDEVITAWSAPSDEAWRGGA